MIVSLLCALLQKVVPSILPTDPKVKECCFYSKLFYFRSQKMYPSYPRILGSKLLVKKKCMHVLPPYPCKFIA